MMGRNFPFQEHVIMAQQLNDMLVVIEINRSIPEESFELDHHMHKIYI